MKKSLLNGVMDDLKELRGEEVRVFGQPTVLRDTIEENDGIIDILDVLEYIKEDEFTSIEEDIYIGIKQGEPLLKLGGEWVKKCTRNKARKR